MPRRLPRCSAASARGTVPGMLDEATRNVVGVPNESVTHWGAQRRVRGKWETLDYPDANGVRQRMWPIADLTVDLFRERWGHGEFRVRWERLDPENPQPEHRRQNQGNGPAFALDPEPAGSDAREFAAAAAGGPVDPLAFAMRLVEATDRRSQEQVERLARLAGLGGGRSLEGGGAGDDAAATLRAELAEIRAEMRAAEERRRIEDEHRRTLAERDREIERLQRELKDAEESDRPSPPTFKPGVPFVDQLVAAAANLAVQRPEAVAALVSAAAPLIGRMMGASAPPPAAPAAPLPPAAAAPPAPVPVRLVPRPAPVVVAPAVPVAPAPPSEALTPPGQTFPETPAAAP